jgi:hypothetical protein
MDKNTNKTCGACKRGLPCERVYGNQRGIAAMKGWLACAIRQNTPEQRSSYLSPKRAACEFFLAE